MWWSVLLTGKCSLEFKIARPPRRIYFSKENREFGIIYHLKSCNRRSLLHKVTFRNCEIAKLRNFLPHLWAHLTRSPQFPPPRSALRNAKLRAILQNFAKFSTCRKNEPSNPGFFNENPSFEARRRIRRYTFGQPLPHTFKLKVSCDSSTLRSTTL